MQIAIKDIWGRKFIRMAQRPKQEHKTVFISHTFMSTTVSFMRTAMLIIFSVFFFLCLNSFLAKKGKVDGKMNSWYFYPKKHISNVKEQWIFILFWGLFYF